MGDRLTVPFGCYESVQGQAVIDLVEPAIDRGVDGVIRSLYDALTTEHPDEMRRFRYKYTEEAGAARVGVVVVMGGWQGEGATPENCAQMDSRPLAKAGGPN